MTDQPNPADFEATDAAEPGAGAPAVPDSSDPGVPPARPSPAATAASRARRIGGRTGAAAPKPGDAEPAAAAATVTRSPVTTTKRSASPLPAPPSAPTGGPDPVVVTEVPAWLRWAPAAILVAGFLAMAVVVGVVSHGVWWGKSSQSGSGSTVVREQVSAAAKSCVATANTYKYTAIDAFERAGSACTTGAFTNQFRTAVDTLIKKNAPTLKFTQTAQINKSGIVAVADGQWTILLYGQLAVTNSSTPKGRTDPFAAVARMEKVHGKWLIASLKTVSSPVGS